MSASLTNTFDVKKAQMARTDYKNKFLDKY